MNCSRRTNVLIVADQTADSPQLVDTVARRATRGPCSFTLLVPRRAHGLQQVVCPENHAANEAFARLDAVAPSLSKAAGRQIVGMIGSDNPLATLEDALNLLGFDEVIISMPPTALSRWLDLDLPGKVRALGVPVTEVITPESVGC